MISKHVSKCTCCSSLIFSPVDYLIRWCDDVVHWSPSNIFSCIYINCLIVWIYMNWNPVFIFGTLTSKKSLCIVHNSISLAIYLSVRPSNQPANYLFNDYVVKYDLIIENRTGFYALFTWRKRPTWTETTWLFKQTLKKPIDKKCVSIKMWRFNEANKQTANQPALLMNNGNHSHWAGWQQVELSIILYLVYRCGGGLAFNFPLFL